MVEVWGGASIFIALFSWGWGLRRWLALRLGGRTWCWLYAAGLGAGAGLSMMISRSYCCVSTPRSRCRFEDAPYRLAIIVFFVAGILSLVHWLVAAGAIVFLLRLLLLV